MLTAPGDADETRRRVVARRRARGLRQEDVALAIGVSPTRVNRAESGASDYGLREMAEYLGVPVPEDLPAAAPRFRGPRKSTLAAGRVLAAQNERAARSR